MKNLIIFLTLLFCLGLNAQNAIDINLNKAQTAIGNENYSDAIKHLSKVLEYKNEFSSKYKLANIYLSRGQCRFKLNNVSGAESDFEEALALSPEYGKIYDARIEMYMDLKNWNKFVDNCLSAHGINKKNTRYLSLAAMGYTEMKEFGKARTMIDSALKADDTDHDALNTLSSFYHHQAMYKEALDVNNKIIDLYPNDADGYMNRSLCYAELKDYEKALSDSDKAVKLDSNIRYAAYNNNAFFILMKQNKYSEAIEFLDKALKLKPGFAYAYSNRGFCKLKLGMVQEAIKDLNKSLELDNTNSYAYKNMALIKLEQNKKGEACEWLKKARNMGYSIRYDSEVDDLITQHCK